MSTVALHDSPETQGTPSSANNRPGALQVGTDIENACPAPARGSRGWAASHSQSHVGLGLFPDLHLEGGGSKVRPGSASLHACLRLPATPGVMRCEQASGWTRLFSRPHASCSPGWLHPSPVGDRTASACLLCAQRCLPRPHSEPQALRGRPGVGSREPKDPCSSAVLRANPARRQGVVGG